MDLHIDDFYLHVSLALLALYDNFPRKTPLYVEDLIGYAEPDEYGLPNEQHQACFAAFLWLADEGFLRYESTIGFDAVDQAVITEKCFLRLSAQTPSKLADTLDANDLPPAVLRQRLSLAQQMRSAISERDAERILQLCRHLFKEE